MRWLLSLLLLTNLFVFAMYQGWLSPWLRSDREAHRLADQRNAERLRVVPIERLGGAPARPVAPAAPVTPSAQPAPAPPEAGSEPAGASAGRAGAPRNDAGIAETAPGARTAASASTATCYAFGPLDEARASRLREALEAAGARVEATRIEQAANYLVYMPPADTVAETQRRLTELRRMGRDDAFVIQDGSLRLAISVGLFRNEETARSLVARLEALGETRLRIAPRGPLTTRVRLQARWPDAVAASAAPAIGSRFDAQPRDCG